MIIIEKFYQDGVEFNKIYSDKKRLIERDGRQYLEVIELAPTLDEFSEGDHYGEEGAKDILDVILGEDVE